jgi:hypothetical protein
MTKKMRRSSWTNINYDEWHKKMNRVWFHIMSEQLYTCSSYVYVYSLEFSSCIHDVIHTYQ